MSAVNSEFYQKKKSWTFYIGIIFLIFTLLISGGLYFYNSSLETKNQVLKSKINQIEGSIKDIQSDEAVQVYSVYERNKVFLGELWQKSQISIFAKHLKKTLLKYNLTAKGFNYSDGTVSTNLTVETGDKNYAYEKIVRLLREYSQDELSLFEVGEITNFQWHDKITFNANFTLK